MSPKSLLIDFFAKRDGFYEKIAIVYEFSFTLMLCQKFLSTMLICGLSFVEEGLSDLSRVLKFCEPHSLKQNVRKKANLTKNYTHLLEIFFIETTFVIIKFCSDPKKIDLTTPLV